MISDKLGFFQGFLVPLKVESRLMVQSSAEIAKITKCSSFLLMAQMIDLNEYNDHILEANLQTAYYSSKYLPSEALTVTYFSVIDYFLMSFVLASY